MAVEDHECLQRIAHFLLHFESVVVLLLFAHKEETYRGFADDVRNLIGRVGRIHRHLRGTDTVGAERSKETFRHILRVDADILLYTDAVFDHSL